MSRAFVKDADEGPEPLVPRPVSDAPNYVTPRGLELLREALRKSEEAGDERESRYYRERIDSAILHKPSLRRKLSIEFGATVVASDPRGKQLSVHIVGADESDPAHGYISWESPIAKAFTGHRAGDRVVVVRPAGPIEYRIDSVTYD